MALEKPDVLCEAGGEVLRHLGRSTTPITLGGPVPDQDSMLRHSSSFLMTSRRASAGEIGCRTAPDGQMRAPRSGPGQERAGHRQGPGTAKRRAEVGYTLAAQRWCQRRSMATARRRI